MSYSIIWQEKFQQQKNAAYRCNLNYTAECRHKERRTTLRVATKDTALGAKPRQNRSDLIGREDFGAALQRRDVLLPTA